MYSHRLEYGINWEQHGNSSEIWDKYHSCCIENLWKFHSASPREILPILNARFVVFIPNFTATHAITSTYPHEIGDLLFSKLCRHNRCKPTNDFDTLSENDVLGASLNGKKASQPNVIQLKEMVSLPRSTNWWKEASAG